MGLLYNCITTLATVSPSFLVFRGSVGPLWTLVKSHRRNWTSVKPPPVQPQRRRVPAQWSARRRLSTWLWFASPNLGLENAGVLLPNQLGSSICSLKKVRLPFWKVYNGLHTPSQSRLHLIQNIPDEVNTSSVPRPQVQWFIGPFITSKCVRITSKKDNTNTTPVHQKASLQRMLET